jgi:hypothetical protein
MKARLFWRRQLRNCHNPTETLPHSARHRYHDGGLDISHQLRYEGKISLIEGRLREGTFGSGASAVPARG